MNKAKVKAHLVSEEALKANRMMNYSELCDGVREIVPVAMRPLNGYDYQVLEDVNENVYIIKNKDAIKNKLDKRPLGDVKSSYMAPPKQQELPLEEADEVLEEVDDEPVEPEALEQSEKNFDELEEKE